jgi:hypothetical protein
MQTAAAAAAAATAAAESKFIVGPVASLTVDANALRNGLNGQQNKTAFEQQAICESRARKQAGGEAV